MGVAFFDLDRTVLSVNSAHLWILRERRLGRIGRRDLARALAWGGAYRLGMARIESVLEEAVATLKGKVSATLLEETRRFWDEEVAGTIRPGARPAIERHRLAGDRVVLLTSSTPYISVVAWESLGLDDYLCTRFEEEDGILTGRTAGPLCYGEGKLVAARTWVGAAGMGLDQVTFYTDSYADRPLLEAVGHPVCVDPDPRLARLARRNGWRVERWD